MSNYKDLTGQKFNMLTVIERLPNNSANKVVWKCICDCGNTTTVTTGNLKNGSVKSCGCLVHIGHTTTHGMGNTKLYGVWGAMKSRCNNHNSRQYINYGARGIRVCHEWNESFESFYKWAVNSGYRDGLTIERVDNNGNYCKENCIWATPKQQAQNRRSCYTFEYGGKKQNLAQWCEELRLDYKLIHNRIFKLHWSFDRAILEPVHTEKRNKGG